LMRPMLHCQSSVSLGSCLGAALRGVEAGCVCLFACALASTRPKQNSAAEAGREKVRYPFNFNTLLNSDLPQYVMTSVRT